MSGRAGFRSLGLSALVCLLPSARPDAAVAQAGAAVVGRVYDAETDVAVQNAIVTLEGFGSTLTDPQGRFRFLGVGPGTYAIRVEGFSYAPYGGRVDVEGDVIVEVALGSSPLPLDSVLVEAGAVDYRGSVRDLERDYHVVDAQVLVGGRDPIWTDSHGRFDIHDLAEGVPVSLAVRAFGYLPVDTTLVPDDDLTTGSTYPEEIERLELLQFDAYAGRPLMLQVFTRAFIMAMATREVPLRSPTMLPKGDGVQCF